METRPFGPFRVSNLCLGGMFFGSKTPVAESHRMLDRFVEAGGNFVDTADVYDGGGSERTLQPWLGRNRDRVIVATKLRWLTGLAPDAIREACDASLPRPRGPEIHPFQNPRPHPGAPPAD